MSTLVVQLATPETDDYFEVVRPANERYCALQGYRYEVFRESGTSRQPTWGKIKIFLSRLGAAERLVFVDADAIFSDWRQRIESWGPVDKDFWVCSDDGDPRDFTINAGVMVLRPRDVAYWEDVLHTWWQLGDVLDLTHRYFHEQTALNMLLLADYKGVATKTHIARPSRFNGRNWWNPDTKTGHGSHAVLHWMAASGDEKRKVLGEAAQILNQRGHLSVERIKKKA